MAASDKKRPDTGMQVGRQLFSTAFLQAQIASCCCTQAGADLQIVGTLRPIVDPTTGRAVLLLTMFVTNKGPSIADGVNVTATVPALALNPPAVQAAPVSPLTQVGSHLQAYLGSVLNGDSRSLQCILLPLAFRISPVAAFKFVIAVSGSVSEINFDPVPQNNAFSVSAEAPFPARVTDFTGGSTIPVNQVMATFSKKLQPSSVNKNTFLIVDAKTGSQVAAGGITYDDSALTATYSMPGSGFPAGTYAVKLLGSGPAPILDGDGFALDGNADGIPGGDFTTLFSVG